MTTAAAQDLPNELLLLVFPHLPLKGLIAAQGTCRRWRVLVPSAYLHPARRQLLELFAKCIDSPAFNHSRRHILPHVQPFDRDNFVSTLPEATNDEFKLWLQEWPSMATISWIWPGLPRTPLRLEPFVSISQRGINLLNVSVTRRIRKYSLVNPDTDLALVRWETLQHPIMCPAPALWEELQVNHVDVSVLPLCQFQTVFNYVTSPLHLVLDAGKGGESLKGSLWYFEMGDGGRVANNWVEFLEEELKRLDMELLGDR